MTFAEYATDPKHYHWTNKHGVMFAITPFERIPLTQTCWALAMMGREFDAVTWEWPGRYWADA